MRKAHYYKTKLYISLRIRGQVLHVPFYAIKNLVSLKILNLDKPLLLICSQILY